MTTAWAIDWYGGVWSFPLISGRFAGLAGWSLQVHWIVVAIAICLVFSQHILVFSFVSSFSCCISGGLKRVCRVVDGRRGSEWILKNGSVWSSLDHLVLFNNGIDRYGCS